MSVPAPSFVTKRERPPARGAADHRACHRRLPV